jgi:hypothetical protein
MMWLTLFLYHQDVNEVCTRLPRTPQNASLPSIDIIEESPEQETATSNDLGPSISQVTDVLETEEYHEEVCGTAMQNNDECQFSKEVEKSARQLKML